VHAISMTEGLQSNFQLVNGKLRLRLGVSGKNIDSAKNIAILMRLKGWEMIFSKML